MSPFTGTANPDQMAIMTEALDSYCLQHNIVDEKARSNIAQLILALFEEGATTVEELKAGLDRLQPL
jgi:hypothetical protein